MLEELADELLGDAAVRARGLIEPAYAARLRQHLSAGTCVAARLARLWSLLLLELWCRIFVDRRGASAIDTSGMHSQLPPSSAASRLGCGSAATLGRYRQRPRATGYIRWAFRRQTDAIFAKSASNTRNWHRGGHSVEQARQMIPSNRMLEERKYWQRALRLRAARCCAWAWAVPRWPPVRHRSRGKFLRRPRCRSRPGWPSIRWHSTIPSWRPTARASRR